MIDTVEITLSYGKSKGGETYAYIRPKFACDNKSYRVKYGQGDVLKCIRVHFNDVIKNLTEMHTIGAKDEKSALKEYWRICEKSKIRQKFEVTKIDNWRKPQL